MAQWMAVIGAVGIGVSIAVKLIVMQCLAGRQREDNQA